MPQEPCKLIRVRIRSRKESQESEWEVGRAFLEGGEIDQLVTWCVSNPWPRKCSHMFRRTGPVLCFQYLSHQKYPLRGFLWFSRCALSLERKFQSSVMPQLLCVLDVKGATYVSCDTFILCFHSLLFTCQAYVERMAWLLPKDCFQGKRCSDSLQQGGEDVYCTARSHSDDLSKGTVCPFSLWNTLVKCIILTE